MFSCGVSLDILSLTRCLIGRVVPTRPGLKLLSCFQLALVILRSAGSPHSKDNVEELVIVLASYLIWPRRSYDGQVDLWLSPHDRTPELTTAEGESKKIICCGQIGRWHINFS